MTWEGIDQRKFPRVSYKCLIHVTKEGREEDIETQTENIGTGGICVELDRDFGLFEVVSLEIFLKEGEDPIKCNGTTVWIVRKHPVGPSEPIMYDTGIEFRDISDEDRVRVTDLIQDILEARS